MFSVALVGAGWPRIAKKESEKRISVLLGVP